MSQNQRDKDYFRGNLQRQMACKRNLLIETDRAVVMQDQYPKAQYHFLVVAKEDIENVTKLTEDHLPLLDHMMELAKKIIEEKANDLSSKFRIGFKTHAFMNRLNLHVISDDYYAFSMRRINHWNSFHTELFLPFQAAYLMLQINGCIEEMLHEKAEELKMSTPLKCNHCDFSTSSMVDLKAHLYIHWRKRESERDEQRLQSVTSVLEEIKLENKKQDAEKEAKETAEKKAKEIQQVIPSNQMPNSSFNPGAYYNMINCQQQYQQNAMNPNNPFRQPPFQYHEQRPPFPNQGVNFHPRDAGNPRYAMNPGNFRMHFPNRPHQPHPNHQNYNNNSNYRQGPQPNHQNFNANNNQRGPRFPKNNQKNQFPNRQQKHQQRPPQISEPTEPDPEYQNKSNGGATSAPATTSTSISTTNTTTNSTTNNPPTTAKPVAKKTWNKKKNPKTQGAAAGTVKSEASSSQPKPANT